MGEAESAQAVYDQISEAWREAGLIHRRVMDTPGWEAAVASVRKYAAEHRWPLSPMGPIRRDTWINWLHILSHKLEDGHGVRHANCELEIAKLAIGVLSPH
jgi:hypothetical protein